MSKVKYDGWVLKDSENFLFASTCTLYRKDVISETIKNFGMPWKELRENGYKVVKIRIVEVIELTDEEYKSLPECVDW